MYELEHNIEVRQYWLYKNNIKFRTHFNPSEIPTCFYFIFNDKNDALKFKLRW